MSFLEKKFFKRSFCLLVCFVFMISSTVMSFADISVVVTPGKDKVKNLSKLARNFVSYSGEISYNTLKASTTPGGKLNYTGEIGLVLISEGFKTLSETKPSVTYKYKAIPSDNFFHCNENKNAPILRISPKSHLASKSRIDGKPAGVRKDLLFSAIKGALLSSGVTDVKDVTIWKVINDNLNNRDWIVKVTAKQLGIDNLGTPEFPTVPTIPEDSGGSYEGRRRLVAAYVVSGEKKRYNTVESHGNESIRDNYGTEDGLPRDPSYIPAQTIFHYGGSAETIYYSNYSGDYSLRDDYGSDYEITFKLVFCHVKKVKHVYYTSKGKRRTYYTYHKTGTSSKIIKKEFHDKNTFSNYVVKNCLDLSTKKPQEEYNISTITNGLYPGNSEDIGSTISSSLSYNNRLTNGKFSVLNTNTNTRFNFTLNDAHGINYVNYGRFSAGSKPDGYTSLVSSEFNYGIYENGSDCMSLICNGSDEIMDSDSELNSNTSIKKRSYDFEYKSIVKGEYDVGTGDVLSFYTDGIVQTGNRCGYDHNYHISGSSASRSGRDQYTPFVLERIYRQPVLTGNILVQEIGGTYAE